MRRIRRPRSVGSSSIAWRRRSSSLLASQGITLRMDVARLSDRSHRALMPVATSRITCGHSARVARLPGASSSSTTQAAAPQQGTATSNGDAVNRHRDARVNVKGAHANCRTRHAPHQERVRRHRLEVRRLRPSARRYVERKVLDRGANSHHRACVDDDRAGLATETAEHGARSTRPRSATASSRRCREGLANADPELAPTSMSPTSERPDGRAPVAASGGSASHYGGDR